MMGTMSQPSFWWQKYGTLAQMARASVALLGFVAILFQINEICAANRASSARQAFLGYTDLAFATYGAETQQWVRTSMKSAGAPALHYQIASWERLREQ
jgi:hypothetical protein